MPADESEGGLLTSSLYLPQRYHNEQAEPGCTRVSRTRRFSIQQAGCGRVDRRMGRRQDALLERSCGPQPPGQKARLRFSFGAESLAVIRERVAMAGSHLSDLAESGIVPEWLQKISGPVASGARKAATYWGAKFGVSDSIAV